MALKNWGNRPWRVEFTPQSASWRDRVDFAVVGGGFTGLAAAAWIKRLSAESTVALFEAGELGAGASGHTGGMVLGESAVGNLPGLGDVLAGYQTILRELGVDAELQLPGVHEIGRSKTRADSPIRWSDSGELGVVNEMPGGSIDPGKMVGELGAAAERLRVAIFEKAEVQGCEFGTEIQLQTSRGICRAKKVLFATNAYAFELTGWSDRAEACFTIAVATEELSELTIREIGLDDRKPFYTVDFPYLWGRMLGRQVIFGSGLVHFADWREMESLDISKGEAAELFGRLEGRIHQFHPALRDVGFTHRWGGPICISDGWKPIFEHHSESENAVVLGGYSGHGVAQSVHLGAWAAEVLLGNRKPPEWGK